MNAGQEDERHGFTCIDVTVRPVNKEKSSTHKGALWRWVTLIKVFGSWGSVNQQGNSKMDLKMERLKKTLLCFPLFVRPHKTQTFEREVDHRGSSLLLLWAISPLLSLTSDCEMAVMSSRLVCFFVFFPPLHRASKHNTSLYFLDAFAVS